MDSSNILALFAVIATVAGIAVTIALFIISGLKADQKSAHESASKSNTNLWDAVNKNHQALQSQIQDITHDLSKFKEHVALAHPREERVNEKMEFHKAHTDQVLSGINHRLQRIESESKEVMQAVSGLSSRQEEGMEAVTTLLKKLLEEKTPNA